MAQLLEETFRGLPTPMKFKISVSGCPNCCANTKLNDFGIHGVTKGWKIFVGGKMGNAPVIAQELVSSVASEDVPKYLAAVLRVYRERGEASERLAATIARLGLETFQAEVQDRLGLPYDDLAHAAVEARAEAERSECLGPLEA
jgi:NAD(P)H-nitrite reductase large subunit